MGHAESVLTHWPETCELSCRVSGENYMKLRSVSFPFLAVLILSNAVAVRADGDEQGNPSPNGQHLFDTQLMRVPDLNIPNGNPNGQQLGPFFGPNGTDPLENGRVQVLRNRKAQVELRG